MSLKHEFVTLAQRDGANIRELCRRFAISPPTAYQLLDRYEREGKAGLAERSRRPHHSPNRTTAELEQAVLAVRDGTPPGEAARYDRSCSTAAISTCPAPALSRRSCVGTTGLPPTSQPRATGNGSSTPSPTTCGRWTSRATSPPEQAAVTP